MSQLFGQGPADMLPPRTKDFPSGDILPGVGVKEWPGGSGQTDEGLAGDLGKGMSWEFWLGWKPR